jgi:hypothetical protein
VVNNYRHSDDDPAMAPPSHWSQVAQRHYEPGERRELTTEIVYTIAAAKDASPEELSPALYNFIDVPAIEDTFFGPESETRPEQGVGSVRFRYGDYLVTIQSDGWIQVYEPDDDDDVIAD